MSRLLRIANAFAPPVLPPVDTVEVVFPLGHFLKILDGEGVIRR